MAKRILIVDDAVFMRTRLRMLVESLGVEVAGEACDGEEAVAAYGRLKPDIVFMDITMPVMDGLTALRHIIAADPNARVVMISALKDREVVLEALKTGARDYVQKPFDEERLKETLSRLY